MILAAFLALTIGGIIAYVDWDLSLPHRWSAEMEAYEQRCLLRDPLLADAWADGRLDALACAARVAAARRVAGSAGGF